MYKLSKLLPQSGQQNVTVSVSGGQESLFQIPARQVFNTSKSQLSFTYTIPVSAGAGIYQRAFMNCMPAIRQIQLYSTNGIYLCDLNFANNYTRVVWDPETSVNEFLTYIVPQSIATTAGVGLSNPINAGNGFLLNRNNDVKIYRAAQAAVDQTATGTRVGIANDANTAFGAAGAAPAGPLSLLIPAASEQGINSGRPGMINYGSDLNYTEPQYVMRSSVNADNGMIINVDMPLELYKNTVFSMDHDLYFGNTLTLRIVWEGSNRIYYRNSTNAVAGDAVGNPDANTPVAATLPVAITNLSLYLAIQTNPSIISSVVSQVQAGKSMILPWVNSYMNNLLGTTQSVQIKLTRNDGKRLCKVYHSVFNNTTTANLAYDINNLGNAAGALTGLAAKVTQYYTLLNRLRQQEFNVDTTQLDDWKLNKDYLKGSVIQSANIYEYNWFHIDDYTGLPAIESKKLQNGEAGLDLSLDQQWEFFGTQMINGTYNHNTFAILQKVLTVTEQGFVVS